jgi:hypothetical protein
MAKAVNIWINYENWKAAYEWIKTKELEWQRLVFYGYRGPKDGFHKWLDSKQQEQQGSNEQGSIPLKDSIEVSKRDGNSTLLCIKERDNLLQDAAMRIPSIRALLANEGGCLSDKSRSSLRTPIKVKI